MAAHTGTLSSLIRRDAPPANWVEGEKIPWDDPAFSARMLREHLAQTHDAASRRTEKIAAHIAWIERTLLTKPAAQILDLGCGPGLYAQRLAQRGHRVDGIDFSPASIDYARSQAGDLALTYTHADIRRAEYGKNYDLALLIFGEFNVFCREDVRCILQKIHAALKPGASLLLEPHTYDFVRQVGHAPATWHSMPSGLFSECPHLYLEEHFWHPGHDTSTARYHIIDAEESTTKTWSASMQAYRDEQYHSLLAECGFADLSIFPSLLGKEDPAQEGLFALTAQRS